MAHFQPKPVEAWQWDGTRDGALAIARAIGPTSGLTLLRPRDGDGDGPVYLGVPVGLNGHAYADPRDWIIKEPSGALRVVGPAAFAANYCPIDKSTEQKGEAA